VAFTLAVALTAVALGSGCGSPRAPDPSGVCEQFMKLKNARDGAAADLLGATPVVPDRELTKDEADRLQTDLFLRQDVRVVEVRRDRRAQKEDPTKFPYFVLVTQGQVSGPKMTIATSKGPESGQRFMSNPDLIVEVRDGKIYGVEARLHMD
jgi:hypothetical protein